MKDSLIRQAGTFYKQVRHHSAYLTSVKIYKRQIFTFRCVEHYEKYQLIFNLISFVLVWKKYV